MEWSSVYRLYEPPEVYGRRNDPQKLHDLANVPERTGLRRIVESSVLRWMVESSDFLALSEIPENSQSRARGP